MSRRERKVIPTEDNWGNANIFHLFHQHPATAIGKKYDQIHHDDHQVIVPAVGFLALETGMPDEDLLLDGAKHDEDQSRCGKLCKDTEGYAHCSRHSRYSQKNGKAFTHTDTFASLIGLRNVTPAAGDEDQGRP
jgi:hypothetical protein